MKTEVHQNETGYQINLIGRLDVEKTNYLRGVLVREFANSEVEMNFKSLVFVGSNGILHFFKMLDEIAAIGSISFNISNLADDFKRIVKSYNYNNLSFDFISEANQPQNISENSGLWNISEVEMVESDATTEEIVAAAAGDSIPN